MAPNWWSWLKHKLSIGVAPWYDEAAADDRDRRSEAIRHRSIAARMAAERSLGISGVRANYRLADRRLGRR